MDKIFPAIKQASSLYDYMSTIQQLFPHEINRVWRTTNGNVIREVNVKGHTYTIKFPIYEHVKSLTVSSNEMYLFIKFEKPVGSHTTKKPFMTISDDFYGFHKFYNFDFYHHLKFMCGNDTIFTEAQKYQKYYINPNEDDIFNMNLSLHKTVIEQIGFNSKLKAENINNITLCEYQIPFDDIYDQIPSVISTLQEHVQRKISGV